MPLLHCVDRRLRRGRFTRNTPDGVCALCLGELSLRPSGRQRRVRAGFRTSLERSSLPTRAVAGTSLLVRREAPVVSSREAVPGGGDFCGDEEHRFKVGARSALRHLTCRGCLSAVSAANVASSAARPWTEHRSAVGAKRRPPQHEPPPGTTCREPCPNRISSPPCSGPAKPARTAAATHAARSTGGWTWAPTIPAGTAAPAAALRADESTRPTAARCPRPW